MVVDMVQHMILVEIPVDPVEEAVVLAVLHQLEELQLIIPDQLSKVFLEEMV
jgi:hypothetical protein